MRADVVDAGRRDLVVANGAGEEQHQQDADAAGEIGAVERVEPLDPGQAPPLPVTSEVAQHPGGDDDGVGVEGEEASDTGRGRYSPPPVAAGRAGSADHPDHEGT